MIRPPAVAGQFYPAHPDDLRKELSKHVIPNMEKVGAYGIIGPHAGYIYSGHVAGATYSSILLPRTFVILCPNHTGYGAPVAIISEGEWATPLGLAKINSDLARRIMRESDLFEEDSLAHQYEHALEVHIPFLQYMVYDFSFVPINVGTNDLVDLKEIGRAIAKAVAEFPEKVLLIASSDMTHYEPAESARQKDQQVIDQILKLDPAGLYSTVREKRISMCGYLPSVAMLEACVTLGATKAKLVKYANSGDVTGDHRSVVGYAGLVIC